jgi:hypothetical protein
MYFSSYNFRLIEQANNRTMAYNYNHSKLICMFGLGFAEALEARIIGEERTQMQMPITMTMANIVNFNQSLLSPSLLHCFLRLKKGKVDFLVARFFMVAF